MVWPADRTAGIHPLPDARRCVLCKLPLHLLHAPVAENVFLLRVQQKIPVKGLHILQRSEKNFILSGIIGYRNRGIFFRPAYNMFFTMLN